MSEEPLEHEVLWLKELERRIAEGQPIDVREMLVALRNQLPRGFKPSDMQQSLLYGSGPSLQGLKVIGDRARLLPDVERAIHYIRDRLIETPALTKVAGTDLATALDVPLKRAERLLGLISSLGGFITGGSGSPEGMSEIGLGREEVVTEYLGFESLADLMEKRSRSSTPSVSAAGKHPEASGPRKTIPNSAFILMNMDPHDASLLDVCNAIKEECTAFGVHAIRIDDIEHSDRITDRILDMLHTADFIIADLTGERPNVYYEVGYAHALGKRPILYRKYNTRLHFDLSVHNVPEYRNVTELRELLHKRFEAVLGRTLPKSDSNAAVT